MGQASQRKASDPHYGKYSNHMRGLVLSNTVAIEGDSVQLSSGLDPQQLRSALFFWDRLAWPKNNVIYSTNGPDEAFLVTAGILQTPEFHYQVGGQLSAVIQEIERHFTEHYERLNPGMWSLGTPTPRNPDHKNAAGLAMELYKSLPVPSTDVPLQEILSFKQKRRPELLMFRAHIEAMAAEIASGADSHEALTRKLAELDSACSNLIKVCAEWQFPVHLANAKFSMNFSISKTMSTALDVFAKAKEISMDATAAAVAATIAGVSSNFSLTGEPGIRDLRRPKSPYKYLYHAQRELL